MAQRRRYRFDGRVNGAYYWVSVNPVPGDSRHEQVWCTVYYFWTNYTDLPFK